MKLQGFKFLERKPVYTEKSLSLYDNGLHVCNDQVGYYARQKWIFVVSEVALKLAFLSIFED